MPTPTEPDARVTLEGLRHIDVLGGLPHAGGHYDPCKEITPTRYVRAVRVAEGPATISVTRTGDDVVVEGWGAGAAAVVARARAMVGAEDASYEEFAPTDPFVAKLQRRHPRLRSVRVPWVVDALLPIVLGQRVASRDAAWSYRKLVQRAGERAPGAFGLTLPPSPTQLLDTPRWFFTEIGIDAKRAATVLNVARYASRIERLADATHAEARTLLYALDGLGPWTVESLLGSALGDPDAVPVGDYWLPHTIAYALAGEPRADDARMLALLEPFRGHRGRVVRLVYAAGIATPRYAHRSPPPPFRRA